MVLRLAKLTVVFLVGLTLVAQGVFPAHAESAAPATKPSCCCTGCDSKSCSTPACCVRPTDKNPVPVTPAPVRSLSQNEWQTLAPPASVLFVISSRVIAELPLFSSSSSAVKAVPLFQRDCCYLI
jgi:hypothetical protein